MAALARRVRQVQLPNLRRDGRTAALLRGHVRMVLTYVGETERRVGAWTRLEADNKRDRRTLSPGPSLMPLPRQIFRFDLQRPCQLIRGTRVSLPIP